MLKTKSGYFFLSFALLIVAVITPVVLVTSLNDLSVKTSINLYKNRLESFNIGENLVDSKFSDFLAANPGSDLYGISELLPRGENEGAEPSLEYKIFSQSSLTPTTLNLAEANRPYLDSMGFAKRFKTYSLDDGSPRLVDIENFSQDERIGFDVDEELRRAVVRERAEDPDVDDDLNLLDSRFLYTLPALGTGDATDLECVPFDLNSNILREFSFIDPLEHPCNYNKLEFGDMIAIPLFYKDANGNVENYDFESPMQISFRGPCNDLSEHCEDRLRMNLPRGEKLKMAILGSGGEVYQGQELLNLEEETSFRLDLRFFSELGLVVNGNLRINQIIDQEELEKPMLILQSENNNLNIPYLEYQVRSTKPFADNKVTMTANVINSGRTYNMDSRQFKPEINVDLGVVFGN